MAQAAAAFHGLSMQVFQQGFWHMTLDAALILTPSLSPLHDTASGTLSIWF